MAAAAVVGLLVGALILLTLLHIRALFPRKKTLYDRLGGVYAIASVVDDFSNALLTDPVVGINSANPLLHDWNNNRAPTRLAGLKFMRTLWLCAVAGGPFKYSPTKAGKCPFSLENAHSALHISPAEFDAVAGVLSRTLDKFNVPAQEKGEVLAAFAAHKGDITHWMTPAARIVC